jgi:AcrR family transcriptional regulator
LQDWFGGAREVGVTTAAVQPTSDDAVASAVIAGARRVVPTVPRLPPAGPRSATGQRLLLVALELFATKGFAATSIRDIARAMDLQPASLYTHTPSKDHVLAELVLLGHEAHAAHIRDAVEQVPDDPAAQLAAFVTAHVEFHSRWTMLCVVTNSELHALPAALSAPSLAVRQQTSHVLQDIVRSGQRLGRFDVPDVMLVVAAIAAMGMRVATWFDADGTHDEETVAAVYSELALRMVDAAR